MPRPANRLRIIGGRWRGSRIVFPPLAAIRPSPDRVRETLFNWLQQPIVGARCLDLFAGSGALGLEALSRGAAHVTFVDREPQVGRRLQQGWLAAGAYIYVECPADRSVATLPAQWAVQRTKSAGQVGYHLLRASDPAKEVS